MREIKTVIFDWAGTTVDYGCFAPVRAFMEIFKEYGVVPTIEEVRKPMGMLKIDHIRTMLGMERIAKAWQQAHGKLPGEEEVRQLFHIFEEKLLDILHLYGEPKPDTLEAVGRLREQGIAIGSTTGYTDRMMEIVTTAAGKKGYTPDVWFSPDSTGGKGRPWPYMIFRNMEALGARNVREVLKIGDTVADILEGKNAGVWTAGVIVGSSEMGLSEAEYNSMTEERREAECRRVAEVYERAGADKVYKTLKELADELTAG